MNARQIPRLFCLLLAGSMADSNAQGPPPIPPSYPDHSKLLILRDLEGNERPITQIADWEVRRAQILTHFQRVAGTLPGGERRVALDVRVEGETTDAPLFVRKKISFATEPGSRVSAWLLLPKNKEGDLPSPAMLCLHQTTRIGKDEPAGLGGLPNLRYAQELAEHGYVALAPDYPNFGESKLDVYAMGYASATMKGIWNHLRAVDVLASLPEVDGGRIGVIGHSLGGHNAIFVALFDPRIKAVVSSCGFNAFPRYYRGNITGWSHSGYMPRLRSVFGLDLKQVPFDFPELLGALAPRAVFVSAPLHDENFDVEGVKTCLEAAKPVYKLHGASDRLTAYFPASGHDFPVEARKGAFAFLDEVFKHQSKR